MFSHFLKNLTAEFEELKSTFVALKDQDEELKGQDEELKTQIEELKEKNKDLGSKIELLEQAPATGSGPPECCSFNAAVLQEQNTSFSTEIKGVKEITSMLDEELQQQKADLQSQRNVTNVLDAENQRQINDLRSSVEAVEIKLEQHAVDNATIHGKFQQMEEESDARFEQLGVDNEARDNIDQDLQLNILGKSNSVRNNFLMPGFHCHDLPSRLKIIPK